MAQDAQRTKSPTPPATRSWVWPLITVLALLATALALAGLAGQYYDQRHPDTFNSLLGSTLLQGAVLVIGGAVIAGLLGVSEEVRAKRERDRSKRLELFRRMRAAHVRIAIAQRRIRANENAKSYSEEMLALMPVARDLEEIREEVKVSDQLYKRTDRSSIMEGIALLIIFLEKGNTEYSAWCNSASELPMRKHQSGAWVADFVTVRAPPGSELNPADEDWATPDSMPDDYEAGLTKSKLKMREYVYGTPRHARGGLVARLRR